MNNEPIVIIEEGITFSPFYFYTEFLGRLTVFFETLNKTSSTITFKLTDDKDPIMGKYRIDPISLPLLLSLMQQIKDNQMDATELILSNYPATSKLLEFLYRSDFFHVAGDNKNPIYPFGKKLVLIDKGQLGGFSNNTLRPEHRIRCYSINDDPHLSHIQSSNKSKEEKRDYYVEYFSFKVYEHFDVLLRESTNNLASTYVNILSELITNGIQHSGSDVFALMFSDKYSMKFSISDNGIGLKQSIENKENDELNEYYNRNELTNKIFNIANLNKNIITESLVSIFETLFFSMTKKRLGLIDLLLNVVNHFSGYFRIHNNYSQIIFSSRLGKELMPLGQIRDSIIKLYFKKDFKQISTSDYDSEMIQLITHGESLLFELCKDTIEKYSEDIRFSAIRAYYNNFNGVHIEVEIPKQ